MSVHTPVVKGTSFPTGDGFLFSSPSRSEQYFWLVEANFQTVRSTTQIWEVTSRQYGVFALVSQTSFHGETGVGVAKCRLFSQAKLGYLRVEMPHLMRTCILTERLYVSRQKFICNDAKVRWLFA